MIEVDAGLFEAKASHAPRKWNLMLASQTTFAPL
jgi:hypothetical protein